MKIVAFDFDGTITTKDTLFEFIRFTKGSFRLYMAFAVLSPFLLAATLKIYSRSKAKERLIRFLYKGTSLQQFNHWGQLFSERIDLWVRPKALREIKEELKHGSQLFIISASLENWIKPWAEKQGIHRVIATQPEVDDQGLLTGSFATPNCIGQEKVNRLLAVYPQRTTYELWAYGDSTGDKELIAFADQGEYNKFL